MADNKSIWSQSIPIKEQVNAIKRISKYTKPYMSGFIKAAICSIISTVCSVVMPRLVQVFIDQELATSSLTLTTSIKFMLAYALLVILQAATIYLSNYIYQITTQKIVTSITKIVFNKVNTLGMRFFDQTPTGSIVSRITGDTESLLNFWNVFAALFEGFISLVTVFVGMYLLDKKIAMMFLLAVPLIILVIYIYQRYSSRIYRKMRERLSGINSIINEAVQGISIIQYFRQEKRTRKKFSHENEKLYQDRLSVIKGNSLLLHPLITLFESLAVVLVIYFFASKFFAGSVKVGMLYAFIEYTYSFFKPIGNMMDNLSVMQDGIVAAIRILRVLDHKEEVPKQLEPLNGKITQAKVEFKDVSFSYDGENYVLKDINFVVEPGETVALVGHTGSGKSSIINILMRFYEFQKGDILIDGVSIRNYSFDELRNNIGLVLQDSFLFYGDIASNIRLLDKNITEDEIREAAEFVNADEFIEEDPKGYQRKVYEGGVGYSSGERQLISFARTMVRQPKLLILDEATASIDTETEEYIQDSLSKMRENRTTIAIAHRLSTIRDADLILVLEDGRIVERGKHEDLIAKEGIYYQMYQLQSLSEELG